MSFFDWLFGRNKEDSLGGKPTEEALPEFLYPLIAVRGAEAIDQWKHHGELWRRDSCSAVLAGDPEELASHGVSQDGSEISVQEILDQARSLDFQAVLENRAAQDEEYYTDVEEGEWPSTPSPQELAAHLKVLGGRPKKRVYLAKIPTIHPYEIPAYLRFGGWNECPTPEEHVTILRRWHERYGIEMYALTGDVIECVVANPPSDQDSAMELAREQFVYCPDIVYQGAETLARLASALIDSKVWFFWWD